MSGEQIQIIDPNQNLTLPNHGRDRLSVEITGILIMSTKPNALVVMGKNYITM